MLLLFRRLRLLLIERRMHVVHLVTRLWLRRVLHARALGVLLVLRLLVLLRLASVTAPGSLARWRKWTEAIV